MKVFLDTNVLLDAYDERDDSRFFEDAWKILSLGVERYCKLYMSVISVPVLAYVIKGMTASEKKALIQRITEVVTPLPSLPEHISKIIEMPTKDIEDAMQMLSAQEGGCDVIVTRDAAGFEGCEIPVVSPANFLRRIDNSGQKD